MKGEKRVLAIGDLHCGAKTGLTPPEFETVKDEWRPMRTRFWKEYDATIASLGKIDLLIVNGDAIDGPSNTRESGIGQIHSDRTIQVAMAVNCIKRVNARKIVMIYGTPFHTGDRENWEDLVAEGVGSVDISTKAFIDVNGIIFGCKHKVGTSTIPYGAFTQIAKTKMWNLYWEEIGLQPKVRIFLRSHVHSFNAVINAEYTALTLPSLQGYSRFGSLNVERIIDWGLVWFDVARDGAFRMDYNIVRIQEAKAKVINI